MNYIFDKFKLIFISLIATIMPNTQVVQEPVVPTIQSPVVIEEVVVSLATPSAKPEIKVKPSPLPTPKPISEEKTKQSLLEEIYNRNKIIIPEDKKELMEKEMLEAKDMCGGSMICYREKINTITEKYAVKNKSQENDLGSVLIKK